MDSTSRAAAILELAINGQPASAFTLQQIGKLMTEAGNTLLLGNWPGDQISRHILKLRKGL